MPLSYAQLRTRRKADAWPGPDSPKSYSPRRRAWLSRRIRGAAATLPVVASLLFVAAGSQAAHASSLVAFHPTTYSASTYVQVTNDGSEVAQVWFTHATANVWTVELADTSCDSLGVTWYAHNTSGSYLSFGSEGCKSDAFFTVNRSSVGSPFNWWLNFNGSNSSVLSFPSGSLTLTNGSISHTKVSPAPTFQYQMFAQDNGHSTAVQVYQGSDKVGEMHMYQVNSTLYEVVVSDDRCDSTGVAWHSFNSAGGTWTLPTAGCGTRTTSFISGSQIANYWWVEWGGYNTAQEGNPPA